VYAKPSDKFVEANITLCGKGYQPSLAMKMRPTSHLPPQGDVLLRQLSFLPALKRRGIRIKVRKDEVRGQGTVELAKRELL